MYFNAYSQISRADSVPAIPSSKVYKNKSSISFDSLLEQKGVELNSIKPKGISLDKNSLRTLEQVHTRLENPRSNVKKSSNSDLGSLSTSFESGTAGIKAIGYDRTGGTSYGKYQIASKVGTFDQFVDYLQGEAPDLAEKLSKSGVANTGSKKGKMVDAWQEIADSEPERFEELQDDFIRKSHYDPAYKAISQKMDSQVSKAVEELIFSTAVQHGSNGAVKIFEKALDKIDTGKFSEKELISEVYAQRKTKFSSSSPSVQVAVQNRFALEEKAALQMVQDQVSYA